VEPSARISVGGAGLVSAIDHYLAVGQMVLSKGKDGSEHVLSRLPVETMTTEQLTPEQKAASGLVPAYFASPRCGFALSIVTRRDSWRGRRNVWLGRRPGHVLGIRTPGRTWSPS
jgi:hypothetical protein